MIYFIFSPFRPENNWKFLFEAQFSFEKRVSPPSSQKEWTFTVWCSCTNFQCHVCVCPTLFDPQVKLCQDGLVQCLNILLYSNLSKLCTVHQCVIEWYISTRSKMTLMYWWHSDILCITWRKSMYGYSILCE